MCTPTACHGWSHDMSCLWQAYKNELFVINIVYCLIIDIFINIHDRSNLSFSYIHEHHLSRRYLHQLLLEQPLLSENMYNIKLPANWNFLFFNSTCNIHTKPVLKIAKFISQDHLLNSQVYKQENRMWYNGHHST